RWQPTCTNLSSRLRARAAAEFIQSIDDWCHHQPKPHQLCHQALEAQLTRCARLDAQSAFSRTRATSSLAALTPDHAHKPQSETVQAVAEDRASAADLAAGHATGDQSAQAV